MTLHQIEAFAIVAAMLGLFFYDRIRYDLVAAMALCAAALLGVVPANKAFEDQVREGKVVTRDLGGTATTDEFTNAIIARL